MGKNNKNGPKANVFKVAGAKSLKKSKSKAVNLGLKNMKQKVQDIDKEFVEINKNPKRAKNSAPTKPAPVKSDKKPQVKLTKEDISKTTQEIENMDL